MKHPEQCATEQEFVDQFPPGAFPAARTAYVLARKEFILNKLNRGKNKMNIYKGVLEK